MHFPSDHHRRNEGQEDRDFPPPPSQVHHVLHESHHRPLGPTPDHFPPPHFPPREEFLNNPPPPSQVHHVLHESHHMPLGPTPDHFPPPREEFLNNPPPHQPEYTTVQHISHQPAHGSSQTESHHFSPRIPSFLHHHDRKIDSSLEKQATCRVFCKAHSGLSLSVVDTKVVFVTSDPSDPRQHWYKDEKYSTQVKDQVGFPSFSLVNKATGQAIKHSLGAGYPVQLTEYDSKKLDESVLWTQGTDLGGGFRAIRMINNIHLNFTPLNADKRHGGIHEGTVIGLGEWKKSDNDHLQWSLATY